MATRVNTKFVLVLAATVIGAAGILGGLWILQIRGDTSRHIRNGDEMMAEGRQLADQGDIEGANNVFARAIKEYGRAVNKEPAELSHLRKVESAILAIRPTRQDQANEYDAMRISVYRRIVRYRPTDPEAHLNLVRELHRVARWFDQTQAWQQVADAADEMWERVPAGVPDRVHARLYRGLANMRLMGFSGMGRVSGATAAAQSEIDEAKLDLTSFVEAVPESDLGWAALAESQLALARHHRAAGNVARTEAAYRELDEILDRALAAVPDGPEVARVVAVRTALDAREGRREVPEQELRAALDRMVELVTPSNDPMLLGEAGLILQSADPEDGLDRAIDLLRRYVADNPGSLFQQYMLANFYFAKRDLDRAQAAAAEVIEADPVPVSVLSRIQQILRVRAAGLLFDIEYRRWELAGEEERDQRLERAVAARDRLAELVAEPENDPTLVKAEGKIAVARRDFATAADRFERVLKLTPAGDFETYWHGSRALEQLGQRGLALDRLDRALMMQPNNSVVLREKARMQYRVGRYDDARTTVQRALEINPEDETAQRLLVAVEANLDSERPTDDPVARALLDAETAADEGDLDGARSILLGMMETGTDKLPLLSELVQVELRAGRTDVARQYLQEALAIQPTNQFLRKLEASLVSEDQIVALKQYMENLYEEERDRVVHTLIHLRGLAREMDRLAEQRAEAGLTEEAAETRRRADAARQEAAGFLARAEEIAADHPALIDHLFNRGLTARDWTALEELVERARRADADQAGGLIFKGRYEIARGNYADAVQTLTEAADRKHYDSLAWRLLGRAYEQLGNFPEAVRSYAQAFETNPNDAYAVRWYVNLLMQTGDRTRALRVLREAQHTVPNDRLLHEVRLQLEADVGDVLAAMDERRETYERDPGNRGNAMRLAALLTQAEPSYAHVLDDNGNPYEGEKWRSLTEQERRDKLAAVSAQWARESQQILDALEASGEADLELTMLRAALLRQQGRPDAAERALEAFVEAHPDDARARIALGRFLVEMKRLQEAIAELETARALQGPDEHDADVALAEIYFGNSMWQQALSLYQVLAAERPDRGVQLRLVECYTKLNRLEEASRVLDQVVEQSGHDFFTLMLLASIEEGRAGQLRAEGRESEAAVKDAAVLEALARAERLQPASPLPHVRRAQQLVAAHGRTGQVTLLDDALRMLERADQVQAGAEATSRVRVEILRAKGDVRGAIGELTRLLDRTPDNIAARRLLVQLYAESGNFSGALKVVEDAIRANPGIALWHETKGELHALQRELDQAATAFTEAYRLQPNTARLAKYAEIGLSVERPKYEEISGRIALAADSLEGSPLLRTLYARALAGTGRRDEAKQQMRLAWRDLQESLASESDRVIWFRSLQVVMSKQDASDFEQFVRDVTGEQLGALELNWLARTWFATGSEGWTRALELLDTAYEQCPTENTALRIQISIDKGQFQVVTGDLRGAAESFERVLELDPEHPLALNNAAYLYADHLDDPEKAVGFAERAAEVKKDDPFVLDTLGWTYFKLGRYDDAEDALRRSIQLGSSAENNLHLARVFTATSRFDKAARYLQDAARLQPGEETQAEIDRLTEEIADQIRQPASR